MTIVNVTMYRVVCDVADCEESAQEGEYFAWQDAGIALDEAINGDWYVGEFGEFCCEHAPRCLCGVRISGDPEDEDGLCENCAESEVGAVTDPVSVER